jgi:hypothetical protein
MNFEVYLTFKEVSILDVAIQVLSYWMNWLGNFSENKKY